MFENLSKINYLFLYLCLINSTLQAAYRASTFEKVKSYFVSTASGALVVGGVRDIYMSIHPGDRFECSME